MNRDSGADAGAAAADPTASMNLPRAIDTFGAASRRDLEATCDCVVVPHDADAAAACVDQSLSASAASRAFLDCLERRLASGPAAIVDAAVGTLGCLGTVLDVRVACLAGDPGHPKAAPDCEDVDGRAACEAAAEPQLDSCWERAPPLLEAAFVDCS